MDASEGPEKNTKREFMTEKIVRQPLSGRRLAKRAALLAGCAVLFGSVSAVSFVAVRPIAERFLGQNEPEETTQVSFPKDEPESMQAAEAVPETEAPLEVLEEKEFEDAVNELIKEYHFDAENVNSLYGAIQNTAVQAGRGIVTVSSEKQQLDLFGNPVERTGDYAGAVIAKSGGKYLIFTCEDAVRGDEITVSFRNGVSVPGALRRSDRVLGMAVAEVNTADIPENMRDQIEILPLGNSYAVKAGDPVLGLGGPAGMVNSVTLGMISYVSRNVMITDGLTRIFRADLETDPEVGTFLFNMKGELIGWAAAGEDSEMAYAYSVSDYKPVLELMTNDRAAPYFGIRGQEVNETMNQEGTPRGVYVTEVVSDSPAYRAGIQNGDIIIRFGEEEVSTAKELQVQIEGIMSGAVVDVGVMRMGRNGYTELDYKVEIEAR